jgi:hypothetical protein
VGFFTSNNNASINTCMRINEITAIKPIKPLTPAKARINALKQQQTRASDALSAERERQQQAKATERVQKAQQALTKARLP